MATKKACSLFGGCCSCCCCKKNPIQCMDELMTLLKQSEGRDKVNKALQYATKVVVWLFELEISSWKRGGKIPVEGFASRENVIMQMEKVHTNLGQARKVFRFFKFYQGYMELINHFVGSDKKKKFDLRRLLGLFCSVSMANYFACDNLVWAFKVGLIGERKTSKLDFTADTFNRWSNLSWLHALLITIFVDAFALFQNCKREPILRQQLTTTQKAIQQQQPDSGEITMATTTTTTTATSSSSSGSDEVSVLSRELDELNKKRANLCLNIVKNFCDVGLATSSLKYWSPNNGILGFCGVVSAVIGAFQMWPSA